MNRIGKILLGIHADEEVYWDSDLSPNKHILLMGESGGGKTITAQNVMLEIVKQGGTVLAFNSHGVLNDDQILADFSESFNKYQRAVDVYHDGIQIPLLDPITYPNGEVENIQDTIGAVADILCRAFKLGINQRTALRGAIEAAISDGSYKAYGFSAVEDKLKSARSKVSEVLAEQLHSLFARNLFVDGDNLIVPGKLNVVNMSRLDINTQEGLIEILLSYIWRLANADQFKNDNIFVFLDECQNLDHSAKGPLALLISEGRKMGVNLILATQMVLQGSTNSVQQRLTQCGLKLLFKPASNRISITAKIINPDNTALWAPVVAKLRVGEFVAEGNLLYRGRHIAYPLVVDGYVGERVDAEISEVTQAENRGNKYVNGVMTC